jgi:hypothetical protein
MARFGLNVAVFIVVVSAALLPFLDKTSAEFFITVFCLVLGLVFGAGVWLLSRRRPK